jgi:hypothetical protein
MAGRRVLGALAAAGGVLLVQVVGAAPAGAGTSITTFDERSIQITYGGQTATCGVHSRTSYQFDDGGDLSFVQVETLASGADPCSAALQEVRAAVTYREEDGDLTTVRTFDAGPQVQAEADFSGPATEVYSNHVAIFDCDGPTACVLSFNTRTK